MIRNTIVKSILWVVITVFVAFVALFAIIQIPYLQTRITQKLTEIISEKTGFSASVNHVNIKWFDVVVLDSIAIRDKNDRDMIAIKTLTVDFDLQNLVNGEAIYLDEAVVDGGRVNLVKDTTLNLLNIDEFIRAINNLIKKDSTQKSKAGKPFRIGDVLIRNTAFSLDDPGKDSISDRFDHNHFQLLDVNADIRELTVTADSFGISLEKLSCLEPATQFRVHNMATDYGFTSNRMTFKNLLFQAGDSEIRDSLIFKYNSKANLGYFIDSVQIVSHIDHARIASSDLGVFAPYFQGIEDTYTLTGNFDGRVRRFGVKNLVFGFGNRSLLTGNVNFDGLPDFRSTFIDVKFKQSKVNTTDLQPYLENKNLLTVKKFGEIQFNAQFLGFFNDFVADGNFSTDLGKIQSDINLKIEEPSRYSGNLAMYDFDLGKLTDAQDLIQKIDFDGSIDGSGFTVDNAIVDLKAKFNYLDFKQYRYRNINTDAQLAKSYFQGTLSINDPNLKFRANGTVDLRNGKEEVELEAALDTAFLKPIHLTQEETFVSTYVKANTAGLALDSITGEAQFKDISIYYKDRSLTIDSLQFFSERVKNNRLVSLKSDRFNVMLQGDYQFTSLYQDVKQLFEEYKLIFLNDEEALHNYFVAKKLSRSKGEKDQVANKYNLDYDITLFDANPLLNIFAPDISVSRNARLRGNFTKGYTSIFSFSANIDTLAYKHAYFMNNTIDVSSSKIADSTNVLAMAYLYSEKQDFKDAYDDSKLKMENLKFEAVWDNGNIEFQQNIRQAETDNYANIAGEVEFLKDSTEIRFKPSDFMAVGKHWQFSKENKIVFANNELYFDDFVLYNEQDNTERQEISALGKLGNNPEDKLTIKIDQFQVDNINPLVAEKGREYFGEINGFFEISKPLMTPDSADNRLILTSNLSIAGFAINDFNVGNMYGLADWNNDKNELSMNFNVVRDDFRIISVYGAYRPREEQDQLDMTATFNNANINVLEPYVSDIFSEVRGKANGKFTVTGTLDYPILKGDGLIKEGHLKVNLLNTQYRFNGNMFFDQNTIGVNDLVLKDERGEEAVFNGGIFHDGFRDFIIDLTGDFKNATVLNTTSADNNLYYGKAVATGSVNFLGAFNHLNITAKGTTNKGTRLFIPLEGESNVEQSDFIHFVSAAEEERLQAEAEAKVKLTGINLDMEIDITPDAYGEIIFDIKTGDIIRGRGTGQLKLNVNTDGEFSMFGDYQFTEGGYNFTLYNIVNKEFSIQPGSSISWYGDPYGGILNIKALYKQTASLAPLVSDPDARQSAEIKRRYPAEVVLNLKDELMSPTISFDINILDYPENNFELNVAVENFESTIAADEQELNRQVFSLIILRKFSDRNSFDGSNAVGSSVSELISNQFSYWLSQVDENLEIDIDLGSFDNDEFNTFQLRLSYTFLDGRLQITRDGGFTDVNNQTNTASVIGDVTVEYLLTQDGKLRVKLYNRNNFNSLNAAISNATNTTQGISLVHVESFDKIKELFSKAREKALQDSNQEEEDDENKPIATDKPELLMVIPENKPEE